jgi:general secretion pathway protein L
MESGNQQTGMCAVLSRWLVAGYGEQFHALFAPLKALKPLWPWRSAINVIEFADDGMHFKRVFGMEREPIALSELQASKLPVIVQLPMQSVLQRQIRLPALSTRDTAAAMGYEISRHTPFQADQVSFTWKTSDHSEQGSARLWVLPLPEWQRYRDQIPVPLTRVRQVTVANQPINLLPKSEQAAYWWPRVRWMAVLSLLAWVLLVSSLWMILDNRKARVLALQADVTALQQEARPARLMKNKVQGIDDMQRLLADIAQTSPSRLQLLGELTRCLPADTVLDRVSVTGTALSMDGSAQSPEAVITALACARPIRNARLQGTLQPDAGRNAQRFTLSAELVGGQTP